MDLKYHLLADASADLTADIVKSEDISIIPMPYQLGDEERISTGVNPPEVLKWYYQGEREGKMTRTSQVNPMLYEEVFRSYAERGEDLLYLSLSGGLSGTYGSSCMAANRVMNEFPGVTIRCVDSRSATAGILLLLEAAAANRKNGMTVDENADWLEANRLDLCHWFMVEDLMFLKRNGRVSPTVAFVGAALNMKPILRIEEDGTLKNFSKKRGAKAALDYLVELYGKSSARERGERVVVIHADNPEGAEILAKGVKKLNSHAKITTVGLTPVIGCHTGPGMCAITHFGKRITE